MQIRMRVGRNPLVHPICLCAALMLAAPALHGDDWPQWLGPQRDGVWRETGILRKFNTNGPVVRWRTPIGSGFTGPAVVAGRVYVADRVVESASAPARKSPRASTTGKERVLCLNEADGKILWVRRASAFEAATSVSKRWRGAVSAQNERQRQAADAAYWGGDFKTAVAEYRFLAGQVGVAGQILQTLLKATGGQRVIVLFQSEVAAGEIHVAETRRRFDYRVVKAVQNALGVAIGQEGSLSKNKQRL